MTIARRCPKALKGTLESLLAQRDLDPEVVRSVVVVAGDGPRDPTLMVARRAAGDLPRTVCEQRGRGIASAFNQGLARCRGDAWVLFLNAGDVLVDDRVLARVSAALATAGRPPWASGGIVRRTAGGASMPQPVRRDIGLGDFASGNPLCHQATFYRVDAFPGGYRSGLRQGMDYDLNLRFFGRYGPPLPLDFPIGRYDLTGVSSVRIFDWARHLYRVQRLNGLVPDGVLARSLWQWRILLRMLRRLLYIPFKVVRW